PPAIIFGSVAAILPRVKAAGLRCSCEPMASLQGGFIGIARGSSFPRWTPRNHSTTRRWIGGGMRCEVSSTAVISWRMTDQGSERNCDQPRKALGADGRERASNLGTLPRGGGLGLLRARLNEGTS